MTANWKIIWTTKKWNRYFENTIVPRQVTEINKLTNLRITHLTSNRTTGEIPSFQTKCQSLLKIHFIRNLKHQRRTISLFPRNSEIPSLFKTKSWSLLLVECKHRSRILHNGSLLMVMLPLFQSLERKFRSMRLNFLLILCRHEQSEMRRSVMTIQRNFRNLQVMSFELRWISFHLSLWISSKKNVKWIIWNWTTLINFYLLLTLGLFWPKINVKPHRAFFHQKCD